MDGQRLPRERLQRGIDRERAEAIQDIGRGDWTLHGCDPWMAWFVLVHGKKTAACQKARTFAVPGL
jgi:hypothetical protein